MEPTVNASPSAGGIKFDLKLILKLSGILAVICLMFMPVAGCKGSDAGNVSGLDILTKSQDLNIAVKIFFIFSILAAVVVFFMKKYLHLAIVAFSGIASLLISFFIATAKSEYSIVELKVGSYLAIVVYLAIGVISIIKKIGEANPQAIGVLPNSNFPPKQYTPPAPHYNQPPQPQNYQAPQVQNYQPPQPQVQTPPVVNAAPTVNPQATFRPKFCPKCGNKFAENFTGKFCTSCGNKV